MEALLIKHGNEQALVIKFVNRVCLQHSKIPDRNVLKRIVRAWRKANYVLATHILVLDRPRGTLQTLNLEGQAQQNARTRGETRGRASVDRTGQCRR